MSMLHPTDLQSLCARHRAAVIPRLGEPGGDDVGFLVAANDA